MKDSKTVSDIHQLITFELENDIFGMDIMVAQGIMKYEEIRSIPNSPSYFEGFKNLRGEIIPIINFKKLFSFSKFDMEKQKNIIRIEIEGSQFGIVVDKVLRVIYFEKKDVKNLKTSDKEINRYISGVIENNNELISILNMRAIFNYTDKTLLIGSDDDEYILKHRRDKNINCNFDVDAIKLISKFLSEISFPINKITEKAVRKYIAKIIVLRNLKLKEVLNYIKNKINDSNIYSNFNYKGKRVFFGIDEDYNAIQKLLTNVLYKKKIEEKDYNLKILNFNCNTGVEAYSIAFLIRNYFENLLKWNIEIICAGTDLDNLEKARKGFYPKEFFSKFYVRNFEDFLVIDNDKGIKNIDELGDIININEEIKKMLIFDLRNVKSSSPVKCDLILVRHLLIDLSEEEIKKVIEFFSQSLKKGGFLVLSELEDIESYTKDFILKEINNRPYYVKI